MSEHAPLDADLLDRIQNDFPLSTTPYADLASALGTDESTVIERVTALRDEKLIRQISAIFDTRKLGYRSSLVAARYADDKVDEAADIISGHPGVSHNYLREHDFNLWFTVAVPHDSALGLERTIELLGELSQCESIRPLPTERFFKIGVDLDIKGGRAAKSKSKKRVTDLEPIAPAELTQRHKDAIRALQIDLPAVPRPFAELAEHHGFTEDELFEHATMFLRSGMMRRFAAVLYHRNAGFTANGMGVWRVPEERMEEIGTTMGSYRGVSHCYQRPTYPDWPYNLFSMTHGRNRDECEELLETISHDIGIDDYRVLYSIKEYKKTRVSYFTPETYAWEDTHAALATH